jgi:hypothetical protein
MVRTEYFGYITIELWEFLLLCFYLPFIYFISWRYKEKMMRISPDYKWYLTGLWIKIFAAVAFCCIYIFYYPGGDTTSYYENGLALTNLFWKNPADFFAVLFGEATPEKMSLFDGTTGYPLPYMYYDLRAMFVIRIITPFIILGSKSFLIASVLFSWVSYFGLWRLYRLFCSYYPLLSRQFALGILCFPSVAFWGSGLLKDTISLSAACWFVYILYKAFIERKNMLINTLLLLLFSMLIIGVKPYIFITLLPGSLMWVLNERLLRIKNRATVMVLLPAIYIVSIGGGLLILSSLGGSMSKFALDKLLDTAVATQRDLRMDYYGGNHFDIGDFDASITGVLSKAPAAIAAGLFKPHIWETRNVVMLFSAIENLFLMGMTILLLIRIKTFRLFKILFNNPLLFFSLSFAILFSFSVGLTTANFGALVRYKIPLLPFYISSLVILFYYMQHKKTDKTTRVDVS